MLAVSTAAVHGSAGNGSVSTTTADFRLNGRFQMEMHHFQGQFSILSAFSVETFGEIRHTYCNSLRSRSVQFPTESQDRGSSGSHSRTSRLQLQSIPHDKFPGNHVVVEAACVLTAAALLLGLQSQAISQSHKTQILCEKMILCCKSNDFRWLTKCSSDPVRYP